MSHTVYTKDTPYGLYQGGESLPDAPGFPEDPTIYPWNTEIENIKLLSSTSQFSIYGGTPEGQGVSFYSRLESGQNIALNTVNFWCTQIGTEGIVSARLYEDNFEAITDRKDISNIIIGRNSIQFDEIAYLEPSKTYYIGISTNRNALTVMGNSQFPTHAGLESFAFWSDNIMLPNNISSWASNRTNYIPALKAYLKP